MSFIEAPLPHVRLNWDFHTGHTRESWSSPVTHFVSGFVCRAGAERPLVSWFKRRGKGGTTLVQELAWNPNGCSASFRSHFNDPVAHIDALQIH
jgi:hypothetical protein